MLTDLIRRNELLLPATLLLSNVIPLKASRWGHTQMSLTLFLDIRILEIVYWITCGKVRVPFTVIEPVGEDPLSKTKFENIT